MKKILTAVAAAAMLSSGGAWAGYYTGNEIIESCETTKNPCVSFMMGVVDTIEILSVDDDITLDQFYRWCVPDGVTGVQLARIMAKYLSENPQQLTFPAAGLASLALNGAFPCE